LEILEVTVADNPLRAELIRSNRKSMGIQVYADGRVVVRAPNRIAKREVIRFLEKHEAWIRDKQQTLRARAMQKQQVRAQYEIPTYESLTTGDKNRIRAHFMERLEWYAPRMGVTYHRVSIRNQKGRWGSCSSQGNLNFNYRLHYLPQELMDYVVVHELAHRIHMEHSYEFWEVVRKYNPDYKNSQKKLKEIGIEA
jgi:predicted metal-dependent hydrolase